MARRSNLIKLPRKRYKHDRGISPLPPNARVDQVLAQGTNHRVKVTFTSDVLVTGGMMCTTWRFNNLTPTGVFAFDANSITLALTAAVTAAQAYTIAENDPTIRTPSGGYVAGTRGLVQ